MAGGGSVDGLGSTGPSAGTGQVGLSMALSWWDDHVCQIGVGLQPLSLAVSTRIPELAAFGAAANLGGATFPGNTREFGVPTREQRPEHLASLSY